MNRWTMILALGTAIASVSVVDPAPTTAQPATAQPASALPAVTLTATVRELGTLGGARSSAADMDGNLVVGASTTEAGVEHAFLYDRSTGTMRDLGTLGGPTSAAVGIDGSVVVGSSVTATGARHAFAFDLAAADPVMRDLGTLGGAESSAVDVDNGIVAGRSSTGTSTHAFAYNLNSSPSPMRDLGALDRYYDTTWATAIDGTVVVGTAGDSVGGEEHAFAYDLASTAGMRDLGTLGFDFSQALDVDGGLVVGNSLTSSYQFGDTGQHGFAYDLGSAAPRMRDLGDLGYNWSQAWLVAGNRVVGISRRAYLGSAHVFGYDVGATSPAMRDLGNLGGAYIDPGALTGNLLVGRAARAGDQQARGFAYDFGAARPAMTDLGPLGGTLSRTGGDLVAVQGDTIAGTIENAAGSPRAALWTLRRTTAPAFRFSGLHYLVQENVGRALVTVYRAGSTSSAVSVRYATQGVSATAGQDFQGTSGVLRFAAGQTRKTFSVAVVDDSKREKPEAVLLALSSPSSGSVLGTPNAAALDLRASDQRVDGWVSTQPFTAYVGNNVLNTTGNHQTRTQKGRRSQTRVFYVRVYNDGNATNTFTIRGTRPRAASVRYDTGRQDSSQWPWNVTRAMRSTAGWRVSLGPQSYQRIRVRITSQKTAPIGSRQVAAVTAGWRGDVTRTDRVRSVVTTVR